ncbi:MAG: hypothetical protein CSA36_03455 [Draconibacterium sp.]|nr:MAG: hypothetical protein CSA36_03455 [Draconibacterium sp.]
MAFLISFKSNTGAAMRKKAKYIFVFSFLTICNKVAYGQNEIGPDGDKLIALLLIILVVGAIIIFLRRRQQLRSNKNREPLFKMRKVIIALEKDRKYYPDMLTLNVKNTGNIAIDIDCPLLIFSRFWLDRKFRIKGKDNYKFYPLYLEKGESHTLDIDLNRFYRHDKQLKKYPKIKVKLNDVKKRNLGSCSIFVRKTLFRF